MVAMMMFLFARFGPRPSRPRWQSKRSGTIGPHSSEPKRMWRTFGQSFVVSRGMRACEQGKKVLNESCGKTIEAKPCSGQTCHIEPAEGSASRRERNVKPHWSSRHCVCRRDSHRSAATQANKRPIARPRGYSYGRARSNVAAAGREMTSASFRMSRSAFSFATSLRSQSISCCSGFICP